jgi:uncharacterized membrane protein YoaK (UPF0700 family)
MIHTENVNEVFSQKNIPLWLISAFKAGFINAAGFLITGKFVSHVTGFGTQVGIATGHEGYFFGLELLVIPISFISGGILTSAILDKKYEDGETPPYWKIQLLITSLLIMVMFLFHFNTGNILTSFDVDENYNFMEFLIIGILCLICGLKNSLVTWSTYGKIRVTHLTGISTDIGLNFIRSIGIKQHSTRFKEKRFVNAIRILTLFSFSVGSFVSAILYPKINYKVFLIPVVISIGMSIISLIDTRIRMSKKTN